jgi:hypothetical protein
MKELIEILNRIQKKCIQIFIAVKLWLADFYQANKPKVERSLKDMRFRVRAFIVKYNLDKKYDSALAYLSEKKAKTVLHIENKIILLKAYSKKILLQAKSNFRGLMEQKLGKEKTQQIIEKKNELKEKSLPIVEKYSGKKQQIKHWYNANLDTTSRFF